MAERQNIVVCSFDLSIPKITAYDIHQWIFATMRIPEHKILMIQIDGIKRQVYIKLTDNDCALALLRETGRQAEYKYPTGELFIVNITMAGMGTKRIRVAGLTPEVTNQTLGASLAPYGKILDIHHETWTRAYRYSVKWSPPSDDVPFQAHTVPSNCSRSEDPTLV
jgi:hypothetical protein